MGNKTLHPHCQPQPHQVHVGTEYCIFCLRTNLITRTSPFAKQSPLVSGLQCPLQKRRDLGDSTALPSSNWDPASTQTSFPLQGDIHPSCFRHGYTGWAVNVAEWQPRAYLAQTLRKHEYAIITQALGMAAFQAVKS